MSQNNATDSGSGIEPNEGDVQASQSSSAGTGSGYLVAIGVMGGRGQAILTYSGSDGIRVDEFGMDMTDSFAIPGGVRIQGEIPRVRITWDNPSIGRDPNDVWRLHKLIHGPCEYFARLARPNAASITTMVCPAHDRDSELVASSVAQLLTLTRQLETICRTVEPHQQTLDFAFGHDIRNLLILAATEAESHWQGILRENQYAPLDRKGQPRDLTINDYQKIEAATRASEYELRFARYPGLNLIRPLAAWGQVPKSNPSWWVSYNKVKHDRERHFPMATLRCAMEAVGACFVSMVAQFGASIVLTDPDLATFFQVKNTPRWEVEEAYFAIKPDPARIWTARAYPF